MWVKSCVKLFQGKFYHLLSCSPKTLPLNRYVRAVFSGMTIFIVREIRGQKRNVPLQSMMNQGIGQITALINTNITLEKVRLFSVNRI